MKSTSSLRGFTIVELLIVIVVIAILAAISIVAYNGIQNRANDSAVESDIATLQKKMEIFKIESTSGEYPQTIAQLNSITGFTLTKGAYDTGSNNVYYIKNTSNNTYAFGLRSKSGKGYFATSNGVLRDAGGVSEALTGAQIGSPTAGDRYIVYGYLIASGWHTTWDWVK